MNVNLQGAAQFLDLLPDELVDKGLVTSVRYDLCAMYHKSCTLCMIAMRCPRFDIRIKLKSRSERLELNEFSKLQDSEFSCIPVTMACETIPGVSWNKARPSDEPLNCHRLRRR